ncbi:MAG: Uma2 family endonuclease [Cyanobacteria bacterium SBLK]|nr:Uma2 family endonuclease [Cyanobacteria bacterium SBLK]
MVGTTLSPVNLRLISTTDYHRMAEIGILGADERVELIAGQIIQKMPKGPAHSALCKRIEKLLEYRLSNRVLVRLQDPIQLDTYSEPEPDIAVVRPDRNFYGDRHPTPDEVYLLVEIADTTINRDLGTKADLYATAGIIEYWVFNIPLQQLHIFRDSQPNGYQSQLILRGQQSASLLAFPDCAIAVQECF